MKTYFNKLKLRIIFLRKKLPVSPFTVLKWLESSQYWERDLIKEHQLKQLNKLIDESYHHTNYYRNLLDGRNKKFNTLDAFDREFPTMDKETALSNMEQLVNHSISSKYRHTTSGSSGFPFKIDISGIAESYRQASLMRFLSWWGVKPADRYVKIWGLRGKNLTQNPIIKKIKNLIHNRIKINVFDLNSKTIAFYVKQIDQFKPAYIRGYTSGVFEFAKLMDENNLNFKNPNFKVVVVTAEVLWPNQRLLIEKIFKCKVANEYGSSELGLIGLECPKGSMHINEETVYVAVDRDNNLISTEIFNDRNPLIKYQNLDQILVYDNFCDCGRTSRIITEVNGRTTDFILCPDNSKINSIKMGHLFDSILNHPSFPKCIKQFKVYQDKFKLIVNIVPGKSYTEEVTVMIRKLIGDQISKDLEVEIILVEKIELEKSGKRRSFVRLN